MKKSFILFSLTIFILSCKNTPENSHSEKIDISLNSESKKCIPYFEFDEVDYYFIKIEESKVYDLYDIDNKTDTESKLLSMLEDDTFSSVSDTTFISYLEDIGYSKNKISDSNFISLNKIFCNRPHSEAEYAACIPIYRDILIFKNLNKITGMAKICFDCGQYHIVGSKENTQEFGQSGDFGKLNNVLSKYRN